MTFEVKRFMSSGGLEGIEDNISMSCCYAATTHVYISVTLKHAHKLYWSMVQKAKIIQVLRY